MGAPEVGEAGQPLGEIEEEHKSDGTSGSDPSSIPSEHEKDMDHNECLRRYALKIVTITWNRDSHGLFDFETR